MPNRVGVTEPWDRTRVRASGFALAKRFRERVFDLERVFGRRCAGAADGRDRIQYLDSVPLIQSKETDSVPRFSTRDSVPIQYERTRTMKKPTSETTDKLDEIESVVDQDLYGVAPTARRHLLALLADLRDDLGLDGWEGNEELADEHRAGLHGVIRQDCPLCPAK